MANVFLNRTPRDIETALELDKAVRHDIGKAVAYTDSEGVYVNLDENLEKILPAYNDDMLKWLLWHERLHIELRHHQRYMKYLRDRSDGIDMRGITKEDVNIVMDILVHDSESKMFPDLVEIARTNLAQMRDCNSLKHTFKTYNLEDMLDELVEERKDKEPPKGCEGKGKDGEGETKEGKSDSKGKSGEHGDGSKEDGKSKDDKPKKMGHGEGGGGMDEDDKSEIDRTEDVDESKLEEDPEPTDTGADGTDTGHHDDVDWSKLDEISTKEFLDEDDKWALNRQIAELKRKKIRLGRVTETLNGLVTTTRTRTYARPSSVHTGSSMILKGSVPGKAKMYLVFDASGSMGRELALFKEIISKSVPQAMNTPCEWFSGCCAIIEPYKKETRYDGYYKGTFKDILPVQANDGFSNDGDRTIFLCAEAEKKGYSPIAVTDGGGGFNRSGAEVFKTLKRTIVVTQCHAWVEQLHSLNPSIQVLDISGE